jgi:DNA-directed RNA polymerase alpha subunit
MTGQEREYWDRLVTDCLNADEYSSIYYSRRIAILAVDKLVREADLLPPPRTVHEIGMEEMSLGVRSYNVLHAAGARTVADVERMSARELMRLKNCGRMSVRDIQGALAELGLTLRDEKPPQEAK